MPRKTRVKSPVDIYHIMLRGVNQQQIFFDEEDYDCFMKMLEKYKSICGFQLYAYCLMGNHIHLLLRPGEEPLETVFRRIGCAFAYWYNKKYERVGHLFQNRYRSEPIYTERGFLIVLRYIIQNPLKAGLCSHPEEYPYSSGREYLTEKYGIADTEFAFAIMEENSLRCFLMEKRDDQCLEIEEFQRKRCTDQVAKKIILQEFGTFSPLVGKAKERDDFNCSVKRIIRKGVSIRQLSRLTGISKKIIENSLKKETKV